MRELLARYVPAQRCVLWLAATIVVVVALCWGVINSTVIVPTELAKDASVGRSPAPSGAEFEWYWSYSEDRIDLTFDAIFGDKNDFEDWRQNVEKVFRKKVDQIKIIKAESAAGERRNKSTYDVTAYSTEEGGGSHWYP